MKLNFSPKSQGGSGDSDADHEILEQIEKNIRDTESEQDDLRRELDQRRAEMDRLRHFMENRKTPPGVPSQDAPKPNPAENDPRYREYFERLKKERRKMGGATASSASGGPAAFGKRPGSTGIAPETGSILRLDDGSIAVYKNAVSGKDYALLYFLEPDGQAFPRGVFLGEYQVGLLGAIPPELMAAQIESGHWNRDLVVFHMNRWEDVDFLDHIQPHQERRPSSKSKPAPESRSQSTPSPARPASTEAPPQSSPVSTETPVPESTAVPLENPAEPEMEDRGDTLEKGRVFRILFNGKSWEAVYWTSDEKGAIVAHDTHGTWSLIRLDLNRFQDGMEMGSLLPPEKLDAIEASLAQNNGGV